MNVDIAKFDARVLVASVPNLDVKSTRQEPNAPPERNPTGFFLSDYLSRYKAMAVITGGYASSFSPPTALGTAKSAGVSTGVSHKSWATEGIFCSDSGRVLLEWSGTSNDRPQFRDCLQAGPMLLVNGAPPASHISSANLDKVTSKQIEHAFVCLDARKNRLVLGLTWPVVMNALVSYLQRPDIGCTAAMRLDVGGLKTPGETIGDDQYLLPSVLAVFSR